MASFYKAVESRSSINGTKLKNNVPYVSSGIPSLDHVIGGGLPTGAIFVVEEDVLGNYSRVLNKYFLSEGVVCKHDLFIASADDDPQEFVKELPQACAAPREDEASVTASDVNKMKIAWRYEGLKEVESSFGDKTNFGHHFDLSRHLDAETIKNSNITYWNIKDSGAGIKGLKNDIYFKLLTNIKEVLSRDTYKVSSKENSNILRINIQSLGSPPWMCLDCEEEGDAHMFGQDLLKFVYCLRVLLRGTTGVAFITSPAHLFDNDSLTKRLLYSVDNAVRIESFAGSSKETNPVYKDYQGLFHLTKLSTVHSITPFVPPSLDLAFKLRRKKFNIEKLHLPPELEETSEREQDDITANPQIACGGFKKKDIEF
ncbi:elongator complex protein 4 [Cydia splendana]|uniref:elongator complex protein 4 n=1 Tax=Cydia splendana TaxID=1100963 RepID=UPI00300CEBBA